MKNSKEVFTTGEAAKAAQVSQQTIIRCFDSGQLKGFRVPGSRFRRIPRSELIRFLKDNGIPTDALGARRKKALTIASERVRAYIEELLHADDSAFDVAHAESTFDGGFRYAESRSRGEPFDIIIADAEMLPEDAESKVDESVRILRFAQHETPSGLQLDMKNVIEGILDLRKER